MQVARSASASETSFITEFSAALDAAYSQPIVCSRPPIEAITEDRNTTRAPGASASSSCGITRIGPSTLVCMTWSKSRSPGVSSVRRRGP